MIDEIVDAVQREYARRTVVLVGDSLGGYLALAAAARLPPLAGVVAGSCTYPMRGSPAWLARASLAADVITSEAPFVALTRFVCPADVSEAIIARGFAPRMRGVTLRALLGRDVRADIAAVPGPIVFVEGAFDVPSVWFARSLARSACSGRLVIVPRAGHGVGLTHPAAFAAAISTFINAAVSPRGMSDAL